MRFQQNQRNKLKEHFRNHIYYKLCRQTHDVFLQHCPTIILSTEELFTDAARTLDNLLTEGDFEAELCRDLWADTLADYRQKDGTDADAATTQAEVAMLFYAVMYGIQSVCNSHYRGKLKRVLHTSIHMMWNKQEQKNCNAIESLMPGVIDPLASIMYEWMKTYFTSTDCLTDEIENVMNPNKANVAQTGLPLPNSLNTKRAQTYFQKAIDNGLLKLENGKFSWIQIGKRGGNSQLAYFCGKVFEYEHSISGNVGTSFPEEELNELFGIKKMQSSLQQVYEAMKIQPWKRRIDELFE